jgi:hypothetical protein
MIHKATGCTIRRAGRSASGGTQNVGPMGFCGFHWHHTKLYVLLGIWHRISFNHKKWEGQLI